VRRAFSLAFSIPFALGFVGCSDPDDPKGPFTVLGTASELYAEWDVNALVPTADVCSRAGIDSIEIVFSNADNTETFTDEHFRWPCGPGYYDSPSAVLREGTFGYQWRANSGDEVVLTSRRYTTSAVAGEEVVLMPVDFVRRVNVRIDATLTWDTGTGQGSCADALVDTMSWELRRDTATGPVIASPRGSGACVGTLSIADLPIGLLEAGADVLIIHGTAADSSTWDASCPVTVFESGPSTLTCNVASVP